MEEIISALSKIKHCSITEELKEGLQTILRKLVNENESEDGKEKVRILLMDEGFLECIGDKLNNASLRKDAAHIVAEIAKTESARTRCVSASLIGPLLDMLKDGTVTEGTQACRALGNICFDNDAARQVIHDSAGLEIIMKLMQREAEDEQDEANLWRKVICGFLFNLINTNETLSEHVVSMDILAVLKDYLERFFADEDVVHMILLILGSLAECESGVGALLQSGVVKATSRLLSGSDTSVEQLENLISFYMTIIENDEAKDFFADSGLFDELLDLLNKHQIHGGGQSHNDDDDEDDDGDVTNLRKTTLDLIVLILTSDKSLEVLYSQGQGRIVREAFDWLTSSDAQLQISGALAIGNIARSETHCKQLVEMGAAEKLLALLESYPLTGSNSGTDTNGVTLDPAAGLLGGSGNTVASQVHHSVLSALRNLAIPVSNKRHLVSCRIIERIKPLSGSHATSIQFKLLGTLRMCVDQQEDACKQLGQDEEFTARLISWCSAEEHEGVKAEASRLVSSLIKYSRSSEVMCTLVRHGAVGPLVKMCSAQHALMQNEALVALTLVTATVLGEVVQSLQDADILTVAEKILTDVSTAPEVLHNTLSLVYTLSQSDLMMKVIKQSKSLQDSIISHSTHSDERIRSVVEKLRQ